MTVVVAAVTLIVMALAAFYVTKISTEGKIALIDKPRTWLVERWGVYVDDADKTMPICRFTDPREDDKRRTNLFMRSLAYLVVCPWCSGFWWSLALALLVPVPLVPAWLAALAIAGTVGILSESVALADKATDLAVAMTNKQK